MGEKPGVKIASGIFMVALRIVQGQRIISLLNEALDNETLHHRINYKSKQKGDGRNSKARPNERLSIA